MARRSASCLIGLLALIVQFTSGEVKINKLSLKDGEETTVTNPSHPDYERVVTNIVWEISGPKNGGLKMNCPQLDISQTENCKNGYLTVYTGAKTEKLCGDNRHITIVSTGDTLNLNFELIWAAGIFKCNIIGLSKPASDVNERQINLTPGEPVNRDIAIGPFPFHEKHRWILTSDVKEKKIDLNCNIWLSDYNKNHVGKCEKGSVTINLGKDNSGKEETKTICNTDRLVSVTSHSNRLVVDLKTGPSTLGSMSCVALIHIKNFKTIPSEEVDSSEYGVTPGIKQTTCDCGRANKRSSRVIYGVDAGENEFPWAVSLQEKKYKFHFCGGSIITNWHVISAAHCTISKDPENVEVLIGVTHLTKSQGGKRISVSNIINHSYQRTPTRRDISILVLKEKIEFSRTIGPICLPKKDPEMVGKYITGIGWGRIAEDEYKTRDSAHLKKNHMRVVDPLSCNIIWNDHYDIKEISQICTWSNHTDICLGDSGGPITWVDSETNRYFLVGLPSLCDGCKLTMPSIHTAVHYYHKWIKNVISENEHSEAAVCTKID